VLSYSYGGSNRLSTLTAIDGALSTFTYSGSLLQTVKAVNNRTTTFAYTGSNLASVTNPDAGVHTFSYDGSNHLTGDTRDNLQHQWAYSSSDMLGTYALGGSGSDDDLGQPGGLRGPRKMLALYFVAIARSRNLL
jgi:YD repeat-containing protein